MAIQIRAYPIVESVISLLGDWFRRRQEIRELREINGGDFARIAHDLCITPAELDTFVRRGSHAGDELPRLLKSLGIDEAALSRTQPVLHRDMIRVCCACHQKARCDRDLDACTAAQHYEEYCPNAPTIDGLGERP